ncbi:hypothetical protein BO94DRAFT_328064 [Aspergillus sclerotioniger CBS 115572]|uniref:Solid-state culture expressed protein n=1 Tax=Aspergillus sclerotioniger CBS 115572 TaxID=1450535 RepID=A0A317X9K8_9EURO|nr:hypothetical protein BO94DRAFT_328064 [Aspergillus sclerotioniger CBS 115572]PWY94307.1 hypothetical protein BO94DRAFT_328064 [Aspergillus sclerotioniger CBS 115572]
METINDTFTNASNSLWSEVHPTQTPDNPYSSQHGDEPLSGIQGKGTATDPYDAGNRDEQPGAPTTKENTAVIPEALSSIHVDHARNPKSPSNADFGPKNVFIDEPSRERKTNYLGGNTTSSGTKLVPSHVGVPEQRTQRSAYGQGSPYPQTQKGGDTAGSSSGTTGAYAYSGQGISYPQAPKGGDTAGTSSGTTGAYAYSGQGVPYTPKGGDLADSSSTTSVYSDQESAYPPENKDLAGSSSATSGAYAYSGQVGQDTLAVRDSKFKNQGSKEQSSPSGGRASQTMLDNAGAPSFQKERDYAGPVMAERVTDKQGPKSKIDSAGAGSLQKDKESASPMMAEAAVDKNKIDSAATGSLPRERGSLSPRTAEGATNKQGAMDKIDSARNLQQDKKETASKSIPAGANGVPTTENKMSDKESELQQKARASTYKPSMDKSTGGGGGIVDSTPTTSNKQETTNGSTSQEQKGKDAATAGDSETKVPRNNKVSEEALRGPQTPAPREPYEFEKRLDQRRTSRSKQATDTVKGSSENAQQQGKESSSSSSHHSHNPMTTLKEKVSKVLHHSSSNKS